PTKPIEEIVTLTPADVATWENWVIVGPLFENYVFTQPSYNTNGDIIINDEDDNNWNADEDLCLYIHRTCLSFLCRSNNITPEQLWDAVSEKHDYGSVDTWYGLLSDVHYHEMDGRNDDQTWGYARRRVDMLEGRPDVEDPMDYWLDVESMEDTKWLLADPTELPVPPTLEGGSGVKVGPSAVVERKVFEIRELFDLILQYVVEVPDEVIASELGVEVEEDEEEGEEEEEEGEDDEKEEEEDGEEDGEEEEEEQEEEEEDATSTPSTPPPPITDPPSALTPLHTLLSLSQVDRWFYHALLRDPPRQLLFPLLMRNFGFGWMLPFTPADFTHNKWLQERKQWDWRAYMITCLRREDRHVRNRWRLHRMAVEFARGGKGWKAGRMGGGKGKRVKMERPEPEEWEAMDNEPGTPKSYGQINMFNFGE
ncbi:hypothetical protein V5O48_015986, partial [Marasmius crinis-equi]